MANAELGAVVFGTGFGVLTHLRALRKAGSGEELGTRNHR